MNGNFKICLIDIIDWYQIISDWPYILGQNTVSKLKHILSFTSSFPRCESCNLFFRKFLKHRLTLGLLFPLSSRQNNYKQNFKQSCTPWELGLSFWYQLIQRLFPLRKASGSLDTSNSKLFPLSRLWHCHWIRFWTTMPAGHFKLFLTYPVTDDKSTFIYQAVLKIQLFPVDMYQEIFLCSYPLTK